MLYFKLISFLLVFCFVNNSAFATSNEELEQRVMQLEKQLGELKQILAQSKKQQESDVKIDLGPSLKIESADGSKNLQLKGLLQADAAFFRDDANDYPDGTDFRRARLEVRGKLSDQWDYRLEGEYAFDDAKIVNAYLRYHSDDNSLITLGQHKPLMGMEFLDNPRNRAFVETASVIDVLIPKHRIGASYLTKGDDWLFSIGAFGEATSSQLDDDEGSYVAARGVYVPFSDEATTMHMGVYGGYQNLGSVNSVQFRARPETRLSNNDFAIDTSSITNVDNSSVIGTELAVSHNNLYFQSEYVRRELQREAGNADLEFDGWYAQASWFVTGESRKYSSAGVFNKIKPKDLFSLKDGGIGAWELAARYSVLDLNDGSVSGGEMKNTTFGVSWYPNDYLKFMGNYIMVDTDSNASTANDEPDIFVLRSQLSF